MVCGFSSSIRRYILAISVKLAISESVVAEQFEEGQHSRHTHVCGFLAGISWKSVLACMFQLYARRRLISTEALWVCLGCVPHCLPSMGFVGGAAQHGPIYSRACHFLRVPVLSHAPSIHCRTTSHIDVAPVVQASSAKFDT